MKNNKFKREMIFFVVWLIIYFLFVILANIVSNKILKISDSINALVEIAFPLMVLGFLKKRNLLSFYGLNRLKELQSKNLLYFVPMIMIPVVNLRFGIHITDSWQQIVLLFIEMLGVGFSEEILFRAFLMKALMNKNVKAAIVVSSSIFGAFHIFNILGGANIGMTILQIIYATAFGFMCSMFFYKTNNIIPCMLCHSATNITNIFMPDNLSIIDECIGCTTFTILSVFYAGYLIKTKKSFVKAI